MIRSGLKIIIFSLILLHSFTIIAQNIIITGFVTSNGKALPGVNVSTSGNRHLHDYVTDSKGFFRLTIFKAEPETVRIIATKIGYEPYDEDIIPSPLKPLQISLVRTINKLSKLEKPVPNRKVVEKKERPNEQQISTVRYLISQLKSSDYFLRENAIRSLGEMGVEAASAIPYLVNVVLYDSYPSVRVTAVNALDKMKIASPAAIEAYIISLKSPDPNLREAAVDAIGNIRFTVPKSVLSALKISTNDPNFRVAFKAAKQLYVFDNNYLSLTLPIFNKAIISGDTTLISSAFSVLSSLKDLPNETIERLVYIFSYALSISSDKYQIRDEDQLKRVIRMNAVEMLKKQYRSRPDSISNLVGNNFEIYRFKEALPERDTSEFILKMKILYYSGYQLTPTLLSDICNKRVLLSLIEQQLAERKEDGLWLLRPLFCLNKEKATSLSSTFIRRFLEEKSRDSDLRFMVYIYKDYQLNIDYSLLDVLKQAAFGCDTAECPNKRFALDLLFYNKSFSILEQGISLYNEKQFFEAIATMLNDRVMNEQLMKVVLNKIFNSKFDLSKYRNIIKAVITKSLSYNLDLTPRLINALNTGLDEGVTRDIIAAISDLYEGQEKFVPFLFRAIELSNSDYPAVDVLIDLARSDKKFIADLSLSLTKTTSKKLRKKIEEALKEFKS